MFLAIKKVATIVLSIDFMEFILDKKFFSILSFRSRYVGTIAMNVLIHSDS